MLNSGEVPNIFAMDERMEICEKMRTIDRQRDKSLQVRCLKDLKKFIITAQW